jgi:HTH-type transcriptional regulator/antitoxin HigA
MEMSSLTTEAPRMKAIASAASLNVPRYGDLLKRFAPKVIETTEENRLAFRIVERLMSIGDGNRSAGENALLSLLAALIEQFERKAYPVSPAEPKEILREADVMGGRSRVSDVLSGKRAISKEQAKRLGKRFGISPAAFI